LEGCVESKDQERFRRKEKPWALSRRRKKKGEKKKKVPQKEYPGNKKGAHMGGNRGETPRTNRRLSLARSDRAARAMNP